MGFCTFCPGCGSAVRIPHKLEGVEVGCPACSARFAAVRGDGQGRAEPPPDPASEPHGPLDAVVALVARMIAGVFTFALVRLPRVLYDAAVWFFPTLVKVLRVAALLAVWVAIT